MQSLSRQQLVLLVLLTLVWGFNWPVMKIGVTEYPPLTFRALSMVLGLPVLGLTLVALKVPLRVRPGQWRELAWLSATNMFVWQLCIILAVQTLSSGRAAILGYTMPIFSAAFGALFFAAALPARAWVGVAAAAVGVSLLLWHEVSQLAGRPTGVLLALAAAATWALGTQFMRRTRLDLPTLAIAFWMTVLSTCAMVATAWVFESAQWRLPNPAAAGSILYNAVLTFGFAQSAWLILARGLPPVASTLSVMMIPVLGVFSGARWLREPVHWQDWAAVVLMLVAIASVLWPTRRRAL